jgi:hypothetical protein
VPIVSLVPEERNEPIAAVQTSSGGGLKGWQIGLIAGGAAVVVAAVVVGVVFATRKPECGTLGCVNIQ